MLADRFLYRMKKELRNAKTLKPHETEEETSGSQLTSMDSQNAGKKDKKFIRRFKLPQNEILVEEFICKLKLADPTVSSDIPGTLHLPIHLSRSLIYWNISHLLLWEIVWTERKICYSSLSNNENSKESIK